MIKLILFYFIFPFRMYCRLAFFKAAFDLFEADYYVKVDDDIYLRPGMRRSVDKCIV